MCNIAIVITIERCAPNNHLSLSWRVLLLAHPFVVLAAIPGFCSMRVRKYVAVRILTTAAASNPSLGIGVEFNRVERFGRNTSDAIVWLVSQFCS
jgi:hypothetical protein